MKKILGIILTATLVFGCTNSKKAKTDTTKKVKTEKKCSSKCCSAHTKLVAEIPNLSHPESVVYDKKRDVLYVSVQADQVKGDGSIASVSLDGKLINAKFITGLNDPKGQFIIGDKLYVTDITELIEIDLNKGAITNRYTNKKIQYLNDVTADDKGNLYVAEMHKSAIFKLDSDKNFTEWFKSPELENPNGLLADGDDLYIAAWGKYSNDNPITAPQAHLLKVSTKTKEITKVTPKPIGNMDGVQFASDAKDFYISDWIQGTVIHVTPEGKGKEVLKIEQSLGDILYIKEKKLLALPVSNLNKVIIHKVN